MSNERTIKPNALADFTPQLGDYKTLQPFRYWCQKVLPLVYDDSLSYYELLCKVVDYLNKTIDTVNVLSTEYTMLKNYVENYFNNLDVQKEINNKLDELVKDGTLTSLILNIIGYIGTVLTVENGELINTTLTTNTKYILMEDCILNHTITMNGDNIKIDFNGHKISSNLDIPFFQSRFETRNEYAELKNGIFVKKGGNSYIFDFPNTFKYEVLNCKFTTTGHTLNSTLNGGINFYKYGSVQETGYVNKIENCIFINSYINVGTSDSYVLNNIIWNNALLYAIAFTNSQINFSGNQIVGVVRAKDTLLHRITNNYFDGNVGNSIKIDYGLVLENISDSLITNNTFTYCENSIKLSECNTCIISSNNFWDNNKLSTGIAEIIIESETKYNTNSIVNNTFNYYAKRQQSNNFIPIYDKTNFCFTLIDNNILSNESAYKDSILSEYVTNKTTLHALTKNSNYPYYGKEKLTLNNETVSSVDVHLPFKFNFVLLTLSYPGELYNKGVTCSYTKKDDRTFTLFITTINNESGSCTVNYSAF